MSATSVLLVAASIVAVNGNTATIDAGRTQHLEPGDRGQAYYELVVDGVTKRIEVGPVVVTAVRETTASLSSESGGPLRLGYRTEIRVPAPDERLRRPAPAPALDEMKRPPSVPVVPDPKPDPVPRSKPVGDMSPSPPRTEPAKPIAPPDYPEHTLPAVPVDSDPAEPVDSAPPESVPVLPAAVPAVPTRDVITLSSGRYTVGLDPGEADFFDQTPRHEVDLAGFSIDRRPIDGEAKVGSSFDEAQAFCANLDLRLPTEEEWEVAAQAPGFGMEPGLFEWTASRYQAYPGNSRTEEGYGEISRVLRGIADWSSDTVHTRRFMNPRQRNSKVGFRCVGDEE